jgi:hypothetical protein
LEGVALQELTGLPHFRLLKAAEMLHSDGWNDTHVMPFHEAQTDATSKHTNGFSLLWTKPPGNRRQLTCENEIEVSGKLFVVSIYIYICATGGVLLLFLQRLSFQSFTTHHTQQHILDC